MSIFLLSFSCSYRKSQSWGFVQIETRACRAKELGSVLLRPCWFPLHSEFCPIHSRKVSARPVRECGHHAGFASLRDAQCPRASYLPVLGENGPCPVEAHCLGGNRSLGEVSVGGPPMQIDQAVNGRLHLSGIILTNLRAQVCLTIRSLY